MSCRPRSHETVLRRCTFRGLRITFTERKSASSNSNRAAWSSRTFLESVLEEVGDRRLAETLVCLKRPLQAQGGRHPADVSIFDREHFGMRFDELLDLAVFDVVFGVRSEFGIDLVDDDDRHPDLQQQRQFAGHPQAVDGASVWNDENASGGHRGSPASRQSRTKLSVIASTS
jgi:hypothetical protein